MSKPVYFVVGRKPCARMSGYSTEGCAELWMAVPGTNNFQCLFAEQTSGAARKVAKYLNEKGYIL